ncbi:hypothetical protein [Eubacterium oxidoreducens]|uniref:AP2/ERF domain-containing protein n=1 Tax=Eubacterium oxidoreducens TaxID=1732 RepID=A0A1G6AK81_EUBOX|nr:hypothetical protein [Eubacterium oxidoreducens]SDB08814.1 hypothetical protein SAMN02910417_00620 [Eubacterium oxidoreducens]
MLKGVYTAKKKNGTEYFRSNITYKGKHISLGSFDTELEAYEAYLEGGDLITRSNIDIETAFRACKRLSFEKIVVLLNYRDNKLYIGNPIYLRKNYFSYYLSKNEELKFDIDDLFYYSSHKILRRQNHLYVNDYGMQYRILERYGIHAHSVPNRDYKFANGDVTDYRYSNILLLNPYHGVTTIQDDIHTKYICKIHINGYYKIGTFSNETDAAIAYNKAVDFALKHGIEKNFPVNFIEHLTPKEYAERYACVKLSKSYLRFLNDLS